MPSPHVLLRPRWMVAHVLVLALALLFVFLGLWQLERLGERRLENAVNAERLSVEPAPVETLVTGAGEDLATLELYRAEATGTYLPEEQVLLRSQVREGRGGYEVITPLLLDSGRAVLVNRGWVPLAMGEGDPDAYAPQEGAVSVVAPLRLSQEPTSTSREEPPGELDVVSRVDIPRIGQQVDPQLLPVYLEVQGPQGGTPPIPEAPPDLDDEGPHLGYAIQWFSFALIGTVGYGFLLRRTVRRTAGEEQ